MSYNLEFFVNNTEGFEACGSPYRCVTVCLPDGNQFSVAITSNYTALELKESIYHDYQNLYDLEVVLFVGEKEKRIMTDDEQFAENLFDFETIKIRSRKSHIEMIQAFQMCVKMKV